MKGIVNMKRKMTLSIILVIISIVILSACGTGAQIDNNVELKQNGDATAFKFRSLIFSVPGNDWKYKDSSRDEPIVIDYRSKTAGGINIIGFTESKSNYQFLEQSYEQHKDVSMLFDNDSGTNGLTNEVLRYEVEGHVIYAVDTAIEEADENGEYTYDFVVSTKLGEENFVDVFFFIKADDENNYIEMRDEIIESIGFADKQ